MVARDRRQRPRAGPDSRVHADDVAPNCVLLLYSPQVMTLNTDYHLKWRARTTTQLLFITNGIAGVVKCLATAGTI